MKDRTERVESRVSRWLQLPEPKVFVPLEVGEPVSSIAPWLVVLSAWEADAGSTAPSIGVLPWQDALTTPSPSTRMKPRRFMVRS